MKNMNLSRVKRAVQKKKRFIIKDHHKKVYVGQVREPHIIQSNGFYSVVADQPEHEISRVNNGKGSWIDYGKASDWDFTEKGGRYYRNGLAHIPENLIWEIEFLEVCV